MSSHAKGVFEAQTSEELGFRYDEWSATNEADKDAHRGPEEAARALARRLTPESRILDAACGTGLAGEVLAGLG